MFASSLGNHLGQRVVKYQACVYLCWRREKREEERRERGLCRCGVCICVTNTNKVIVINLLWARARLFVVKMVAREVDVSESVKRCTIFLRVCGAPSVKTGSTGRQAEKKQEGLEVRTVVKDVVVCVQGGGGLRACCVHCVFGDGADRA